MNIIDIMRHSKENDRDGGIPSPSKPVETKSGVAYTAGRVSETAGEAVQSAQDFSDFGFAESVFPVLVKLENGSTIRFLSDLEFPS